MNTMSSPCQTTDHEHNDATTTPTTPDSRRDSSSKSIRRSHSHSQSTNFGNIMMMREDDAEILERGVGCSSAPPTPIEVGSQESPISPPVMHLNEELFDVSARQQHSPAKTSDFGKTPLNGNNGNSSSSLMMPTVCEGVPLSYGDGMTHGLMSIDPELRLSDRSNKLFDEVIDTQFSSSSMQEATKEDDESEIRSCDRRLKEAAQFAEMVGERPPKSIKEITRVVIEDDDDSENDSDDNNDDSSDQEYDKNTEQVLKHSTMNNCKRKIKTNIESLADKEAKSNDNDEPISYCAWDENGDIKPIDVKLSDSIEIQKSPYRVQSMNDLEHAATANTPIHRSQSFQLFRNTFPINKDVSFYHTFDSTRNITLPHEVKPPPKGIKVKSLEVTKRGISRGNYAILHRKAWLEVSDKYHRYGSNLRMYYKHWESIGHPTNMFFDWLDSKGAAAGNPLPNLPECPRSMLDSDTVLYINNPEEQAKYQLNITPIILENDIVEDEKTSDMGWSARVLDCNNELVRTGPEGWIFVLRDNDLYAAKKIVSVNGKSKNRFHHSSFFGGKAVTAAGILITDDDGCLEFVYPHSGHYRPGEADMQRLLFYFYSIGVDLDSFKVDMQQMMYVSRETRDATTPCGGDEGDKSKITKVKKSDSLLLETGSHVASFLGHKARMIGSGLFSQLHKIRSCKCETVREALDAVDDGGFWRKKEITVQ